MGLVLFLMLQEEYMQKLKNSFPRVVIILNHPIVIILNSKLNLI